MIYDQDNPYTDESLGDLKVVPDSLLARKSLSFGMKNQSRRLLYCSPERVDTLESE